MAKTDAQLFHATTVAIENKAVFIRGPSGIGKSGLALELIALGAGLIADDRTIVEKKGAALIAAPADGVEGLIEARGVGLLHAPYHGPAPLHLIVDMAVAETDRLPPERTADIMGQTLPLIRKSDARHFPAAVLIYLNHGRFA